MNVFLVFGLCILLFVATVAARKQADRKSEGNSIAGLKVYFLCIFLLVATADARKQTGRQED